MFGVAINYFSKEGYPPSVKQSVKFSVSLLLACPEVTSIVLVDGSLEEDPELRNYCGCLGIAYMHSGRALSFAEGYNLGVREFREQWVVTMASDIYVYPNTFANFRCFILKHSNLPIGCLIPYMSSSDLPMQGRLRSKPLYDCFAPLMTFNLNVFPRHVFNLLGGLTSEYSGNYNDVETTLRLKDLGLEVFLVGAYVQHYGRLTVQHGSNVDFVADRGRFFQRHPELECNGALWDLRLSRLLRHPVLKLLDSLSFKVKHPQLRKLVSMGIHRMIPFLQRV